MNIKKCDRCGHITDDPEELRLKVNNAAAVLKELNEIIKRACATIINGGPPPLYKLSLNEKELDLCEECQKKLTDWFEHPEKKLDGKTFDYIAVDDIEEWKAYNNEKNIKAPKGTFGKIYNDNEEETQHGDEDDF